MFVVSKQLFTSTLSGVLGNQKSGKREREENGPVYGSRWRTTHAPRNCMNTPTVLISSRYRASCNISSPTSFVDRHNKNNSLKDAHGEFLVDVQFR